MRSFFGKSGLTLLKGQALEPVSEADPFKGKKYVLVYFSAHWCPPCRVFTPLLRGFYEKYHEEKKFEVVFVSLDKSVESMRSYMESAHGDWLALPFHQAKSITEEWMAQYNFQSIPTLLVFENTPNTIFTGEGKSERLLLTRCGRELLAGDPNGEGFPWPNGDTQVREYYRVLKRNIIITISFGVVLGLWLFRIYVTYNKA